MKKRVLISNLNFYKQGHHIFYQNILFDQVGNFKSDDTEYFFLFNESDANLNIKNQQVNTHFLKDIENEELKNCKSELQKYFIKWRFVRTHAKLLSINEVFLMDFYEPYILALFFSKFDFKVGGIMFRPYNRFFQLAARIKSIKLLIISIRKFLLMCLMTLKRGKVEKFIIFNDIKSASKISKQLMINVISCLDPINNSIDPNKAYNFSIFEKYGLDKNSKIILSFGAISEVKNLLNLIMAVNDVKLKVGILIVGKPIKQYIEEYQKLKNDFLLTSSQKKNIRIVFDENFISDYCLSSILNQVDIVFLAYKNFYFSSGNLGLAGKFNKFSLVPNDGPMADLAIEYNLGMPVNPDSVEEIKESIVYCIENQEILENNMKSEEFCNKFSDYNFAKAILT
jgi:glycosyltransferase involved in cell wall biosynthesis